METPTAAPSKPNSPIKVNLIHLLVCVMSIFISEKNLSAQTNNIPNLKQQDSVRVITHSGEYFYGIYLFQNDSILCMGNTYQAAVTCFERKRIALVTLFTGSTIVPDSTMNNRSDTNTAQPVASKMNTILPKKAKTTHFTPGQTALIAVTTISGVFAGALIGATAGVAYVVLTATWSTTPILIGTIGGSTLFGVLFSSFATQTIENKKNVSKK